MILGLLSLDGVSRPGMSTSQVVSEVLAALAGSILLGQAFLDQQKEQAVKVGFDYLLVLFLLLPPSSSSLLPFVAVILVIVVYMYKKDVIVQLILRIS